MQGLPLTGKTAWAKNWTTKGKKRIRLSRYELSQMMLKSSSYNPPLPVDVRIIVYASALMAFEEAVNRGWSVVLDDLNLQTTEYMPFVNYAQTHGVKVEFQKLYMNRNECARLVEGRGGVSNRLMQIYMERYPDFVK